MRTWKCNDCGRTVQVGYEELLDIGTPMCDCTGDGKDMELLDPVPLNLKAVCRHLKKLGHITPVALKAAFAKAGVPLPEEKPQLQLIVDMHGGTIQTVYVNNDAVQITDVIFTEDFKYLDDEPLTDDGEYVSEIKGGKLKGNGIYAHLVGVEVADPATISGVLEASDARCKFHEDEAKGEGKARPT